MSRSILVGALAALALASCDKPNYPPAMRDWAALVTWDDAGEGLLIEGRPARIIKAWDFTRDAPDVELMNATSRFVAGQGLVVSGVAPDPGLRIRTDAMRGAEAPLLVVKLTRVKAAERWDGTVYYATAQHREAARFMNRPAGPAEPPTGVPVVLVYDMAALQAGGDDWLKSAIEHVRLDLDDQAGGEVIIHQVALVREPI